MYSTLLGFVLLYYFMYSNGFLLDNRTTPLTSGTGIFEQQFNVLMYDLAEERQTRIKLTEKLTKLENELLATQKGVTDIYHSTDNFNKQTLSVVNQTAELEIKYNILQTKYISLVMEFDELRLNNNRTEIYAQKLERDIESL